MSVKRLIAACILAGLTLSTGLVIASEAHPAPARVDFDVPAIHVGDMGRYTAGPDTLRFQFEILPWLTPDGREGTTLALTHEIATPAETLVERYWIQDAAVVAGTRLAGQDQNGVGTTFGSQAVRIGGVYQIYSTTYGQDRVPACGMVHSMQGGNTSAGIVVASGCPDMVRDDRVVVEGQDQVWFGTARTGVLVDARYPVPVRIHSDGRIWVLEEFQRGTQAAAPETGAMHGVSTRLGLYPNETGIDHPFPLSAAVDALMADPLGNGAQSVMRERHQAYWARADFVEELADGHRRFVWTITAADGEITGSARVWLVAPDPGDEVAGVSLPIASLPVPRVMHLNPDPSAYPLGPGPFRFADLASLVERWESVASPVALDHGMNAWGMQVHCGATCDSAIVETRIGFMRFEAATACDLLSDGTYTFLCTGTPSVVKQDLLAADQHGAMFSRSNSDWSYLTEVAVTGEPLAIDGGRQSAAPQVPMASSAVPVSPLAISARTAAGASIVALVLGGLYYFWPVLKVGLLGVFRSVPAPENENRGNIELAIRASPGVHFQALCRTTQMAPGTLRHHLKTLERGGRIVGHESGGYKCYFIARGTDRNLTAAAGALKTDSARTILRAVVQQGRVTMAAAADSAGITPSAATHHVARLEQAGLVVRQRAGRHIEVRPTAVAAAALTTMQSAA